VVDGRGSLPDSEPVDVPLDGRPGWLAAVPRGGGTQRSSGSSGGPPTDDAGTGTLWVAVLTDGRTVGVRLVGREPTRVPVLGASGSGPPTLAPAPPRLLSVAGGSPRSSPVRVGESLVAVTADGAVVVDGPGRTVRSDVGALPDARPVTDGRRGWVLSGATDRYRHGALGDDVEATRVTAVAPDGATDHREAPDGTVIEGTAPILVGGDPLVTASDAAAGARLVLLTDDGPVSGPPVGTGFRWRHQLAAAQFGPDGSPEVAAVRTPHVGGTAEFYRREGGSLRLVGTLRGYSSHRYGSRNLDSALAGDLDGDGRVELLVPDDPQTALAGLRRTADGAREAWRVPLGARLATNVAAATHEGRTTVGVGLPDRLRLWPPADR
jgi:hypothetical protein